MKAFVCDACGKIYRPYAVINDSDGDTREGNALTIVKTERDGKLTKKARFDLCPVCMRDVWDYIKIDLVQKESHLYESYHGDSNENTETNDTTEETSSVES